MPHYLILSGDLATVVEADSPDDAVKHAIRAASADEDSPNLGLLTAIYELADPECLYIDTEFICRQAETCTLQGWEEAVWPSGKMIDE